MSWWKCTDNGLLKMSTSSSSKNSTLIQSPHTLLQIAPNPNPNTFFFSKQVTIVLNSSVYQYTTPSQSPPFSKTDTYRWCNSLPSKTRHLDFHGRSKHYHRSYTWRHLSMTYGDLLEAVLQLVTNQSVRTVPCFVEYRQLQNLFILNNKLRRHKQNQTSSQGTRKHLS